MLPAAMPELAAPQNMLSISNFSNDNLAEIEFRKKEISKYFITFLKLLVPAAFLFGLIGLIKRSHHYWPATLSLLSFFFIITLFFFIRDNILFSKDIQFQLKFIGTATVLKKYRTKSKCNIFIDSHTLKKISATYLDIFDKIEVGDKLYLEIAKSSKYIFKIEKT